MSHQVQLEKSKYRDWVRGGLAYNYLKEGIERFADDVVQKEHARIIATFTNTSGNACNQCSIRSLQPLHKCTKDHTGRKRCPWDMSNCNCLYSNKTPCPNNICDVIMEEILKSHGSTPPIPNWKNTDVQRWYTSPWEVAKCFINAPGYSDKSKAADIDAPGLLHVFINNMKLHTHFSCSMTGKNIFIKCREKRNGIFHSPVMELEEAALNECIDGIIAILEDPNELAATVDAQQAVSKLKQLKQQQFVITTHNEVEVCRDALAYTTKKTLVLNQMIQQANDDIDRKLAGASKTIDDKMRTDIQDVLKKNSDINYLKQNVESLIQRVKSLEDDNCQTKKLLLEIHKSLDEVKAVKDRQMKNLNYVEEKQALQDRLVKLYRRHYVMTSLSPLKLQENDININEVYISPNMKVQSNKQQNGAGNSRYETREQKGRSIHGYHDLLYSNEQENKAIYIVGDVGTGKSSFCKMIIHDWCNAVTGETDESDELISDSDYTDDSDEFLSESGSESDQESENSDCEDDNVDQMRKFDFLFYIPLRKMSNYSETTEMIQAIYTTENFESTDLLERVFKQDSEKCLIVIDGLDEWRPQHKNNSLPHESCGLPQKHKINNATVITLSRPSAKGMLNIKRSEFDQKVELKGIQRSSVKYFIKTHLANLNKTHIFSILKEKIHISELKHLEKTPFLLQQLVWLYCKDIDFGKSVTDIYSHLINIMFGWFETKTDESDSEGDCLGEAAQQCEKRTLPLGLNNFPRCKQNERVLIQTAKVAFESFTAEGEEHSFSRTHLKEKGLSKTDISSLIDVGILVKENCYDPTQERTQFSFIHLSYHEFFAAIYVSCQFDEQQSDKNSFVLKELFPNVETAVDILQLSNLLKMICGLCPFAILQVSHFISNIVKSDGSITRDNTQYFCVDIFIDLIQQLIFSILSECDRDYEKIIHLSDVYIALCPEMSELRLLIPDDVTYLYVNHCSNEEVWKWITQLKHLQYLHIHNCYIPGDQRKLLSSFIQEVSLRCFSLSESTGLSKQNDFSLRIDIEYLDTFELCPFGILYTDLLLNARSLTDLRFGTGDFVLSNLFLTYNGEVDYMVHTLHQLQTLTIVNAVIIEESLSVTPEMANLQHITLHDVQMSQDTWRTFVDSLLNLQQSVEVHISNDYLTGRRSKYILEGSRYVREKGNLFQIMDETKKCATRMGPVFIRFRTRKQ